MDDQVRTRFDASRDFSNKAFQAGCYAPFTNLVFDPHGRVRACCHNDEYIFGNIRTERLRDIWNGERISSFRELMKQYDFSAGCFFCENKVIAGLGGNHTIRETQLLLLKFEEYVVSGESLHWPRCLEFQFSNKCNLECATCSGEFSALIRDRREHLPPIEPAYDDVFFDDLRPFLPHVAKIEFKGGEPFLIPEAFRVWEMLIDDGLKPSCFVTTNGTVFGPRVERVLDQFPVDLNVSMDGVTRETFENIRKNASFDRVVRNLRRFREICRSNGRYIGISYTISRLNWHEFVDFLLFAEDEGIPVSACDVFGPYDLSLFTLPLDEFAQILQQSEDGFAKFGHRLTINRSLLENRIVEYRCHLAQPNDRLQHCPAPFVFIQVEKENKFSVVRPFLTTSGVAMELTLTREEARRRLQEWSQDGVAGEIDFDLNDVVIGWAPSTKLDVMGVESPVGLTFTEFAEKVFDRLGPDYTVLANFESPTEIDRIVTWQRDDRHAIIVRIIYVPQFEERQLDRVTILLALKHQFEPSVLASESGADIGDSSRALRG